MNSIFSPLGQYNKQPQSWSLLLAFSSHEIAVFKAALGGSSYL
jgi:hypothetical protein